MTEYMGKEVIEMLGVTQKTFYSYRDKLNIVPDRIKEGRTMYTFYSQEQLDMLIKMRDDSRLKRQKQSINKKKKRQHKKNIDKLIEKSKHNHSDVGRLVNYNAIASHIAVQKGQGYETERGDNKSVEKLNKEGYQYTKQILKMLKCDWQEFKTACVTLGIHHEKILKAGECIFKFYSKLNIDRLKRHINNDKV